MKSTSKMKQVVGEELGQDVGEEVGGILLGVGVVVEAVLESRIVWMRGYLQERGQRRLK